MRIIVLLIRCCCFFFFLLSKKWFKMLQQQQKALCAHKNVLQQIFSCKTLIIIIVMNTSHFNRRLRCSLRIESRIYFFLFSLSLFSLYLSSPYNDIRIFNSSQPTEQQKLNNNNKNHWMSKIVNAMRFYCFVKKHFRKCFVFEMRIDNI